MTVLIVVLWVEAIPLGALVSALFDRSLRRRSRFWQRFAGIVIAVVLPELAAVAAPVGEQTVVLLIWGGLAWGILLLVPAWFVLFDRRGLDPGSANGDDDGPGPENGPPTPRPPIGGIPLPDAEPSSARVRDHRPPRRTPPPRRPVREPERPPARLWPLRLRPSKRLSKAHLPGAGTHLSRTIASDRGLSNRCRPQ